MIPLNTADGAATNASGIDTSTSDTSDPPNKGLSTGAKVGIGIGAGLGAVLVVAVVWIYWYRRQKSKAGGVAELADNQREFPEVKYQRRDEKNELPGESEVAEMDGQRFYQLEAR